MRRFILSSDRQVDLTVHDGRDNAVDIDPYEHDARWRAELPDTHQPYRNFGENFTTEGLVESLVDIGDELRVGDARVVLTYSRKSCFKLGIRFGRPDMVKCFHQSRRPALM